MMIAVTIHWRRNGVGSGAFIFFGVRWLDAALAVPFFLSAPGAVTVRNAKLAQYESGVKPPHSKTQPRAAGNASLCSRNLDYQPESCYNLDEWEKDACNVRHENREDLEPSRAIRHSAAAVVSSVA
jgi:hypothetical protein